jgi:hypothetical protein
MRRTWWPDARRLSLNGGKDIGDINAHPRLVVEVKADKSLAYPEFLRETAAEVDNAGADIGVCVIKPPGYGVKRVAEWWMLFSDATFHTIVSREGYCGPSFGWMVVAGSRTPFDPGLWLKRAQQHSNSFDPGEDIPPGVYKDSRTAGGMRFVYLADGLELLANNGYGMGKNGNEGSAGDAGD